MLDFDERDLLALAEQAGFGELQRAAGDRHSAAQPLPWDTMLNSVGNPDPYRC